MDEVVDDGDEESETTEDGVDIEMLELFPEEFEVIIGFTPIARFVFRF
jgi:hypothetical protein